MTDAPDTAEVVSCYRHAKVAAASRCRRCERPICTDCMISAPVGWQCPKCVKGAPAVINARTMRTLGPKPMVATALIVLNALAFLPTVRGGNIIDGSAGGFIDKLVLSGPLVARGDWWRIVTSGFGHLGLIHIGMNMALLWYTAQALEPRYGRIRFAALYFACLVGGSVGVLALSPDAPTAGASGAVFGLMGATFVAERIGRGRPVPIQIGPLLALNLLFTFGGINTLGRGAQVSVGGHVGGLATGLFLGFVIERVDNWTASLAITVATLLVAFGACIVIA